MSNGQDSPLHLRGNVKLPQDSETPLTPLRVPVGTALYLYIRSVDSVNANTIGQDYVTFRYQGKDLAFAVCDGVGQSFMGDLAARLIGDGLVEWLMKAQRPANAEAFSKATAEALNAMTSTTAQQVAMYKLPERLPPILTQALEMQRKYGSESMFVAGRLALDGSDPWVALCWLGDSPVAAVDIDGELVDLGPHGSTSERWNATTGVKGEVHTWVGDARRVARVAGYTDGLGTNHVPTDADLARMVAGWMDNNPPADDASLFDVRLAYSPETVGEQTPDEARRMLNLPTSASEPGYFNIEAPAEPRPIVVDEGERSPVAEMTPIEVPPPATPATGEWKPLTDQADAAKTAIEKALTNMPIPTPTPLGDLSTQQQVQMWQQAALLGLTSAALAMMMLERLVTKPDKDS